MSLKKIIFLNFVMFFSNSLYSASYLKNKNFLYLSTATALVAGYSIWKLIKPSAQPRIDCMIQQSQVAKLNDQDLKSFLRLMSVHIEPETHTSPAAPVCSKLEKEACDSFTSTPTPVSVSVFSDQVLDKTGLDKNQKDREEQAKTQDQLKIKDDNDFEPVQYPITTKSISDFETLVRLSSSNNMSLVKNLKSYKARLDYFLNNIHKIQVDLREIYRSKLINLKEHLNKTGPWVLGKKIANSIFAEEKLSAEHLNKFHLENIINLVWYFYQLAENKNEGFHEGTFSIEDPNGALFNFLSKHEQAYKRICSHYKEINKPKYGLDIPTDMRGAFAFPNDKYHILFGQLDNGYTFVKPEKYGIKTWADFAFHAVEYVESVGNKLTPGADDKEDMKKERVPADIFNAWKKLVEIFIKEPEKVKKYIEDVNKYGIKKIIQYLNEQQFTENFLTSNGQIDCEEKEKIMLEFITILSNFETNSKQAGENAVRKGREVILRCSEIIGA